MINLTFVGDISFNDAGKKQEFDFSDFLKLNFNADFTIGNLEALASKGEFNSLKNPRVTCNEVSLNKLGELGINLITLAHNHIYDAKLSGFKATINKLKELNIPHVGAGLTKVEAEEPFILHKNNLKIGFLNYCTADTNPSLPEDCEIFLNTYEVKKIVRDIKALKEKCHHVILLLHWGGSFEGGYFPEKHQIRDAEKFSKAGASLIVGHHPHALQPNINIGNLPVYFSLGNFIFFDIKSENGLIKLSNRRKKGGVLQVEFSDSKLEKQKVYHSRQIKGTIKLTQLNLVSNFRTFLFQKFHEKPVFWNLYKFQFNYINPLFYFLFVQEGGYKKFRKLNLGKITRFLWKK